MLGTASSPRPDKPVTAIEMALRLATSLALASLALAVPHETAESLHKRYIEERNGITYNMFKRAGQKSTLSYVENSGICVSF